MVSAGPKRPQVRTGTGNIEVRGDSQGSQTKGGWVLTELKDGVMTTTVAQDDVRKAGGAAAAGPRLPAHKAQAPAHTCTHTRTGTGTCTLPHRHTRTPTTHPCTRTHTRAPAPAHSKQARHEGNGVRNRNLLSLEDYSESDYPFLIKKWRLSLGDLR